LQESIEHCPNGVIRRLLRMIHSNASRLRSDEIRLMHREA
jgi:hypothetical protein